MSKPIELREADFKREIWKFSYAEEMKQEFFEYWTEPNKSGTKLRFELEKTWSTSRRLSRWARNGKEINKKVHHMGATIKDVKGLKLIESSEPITNEEKLDAFIYKFSGPGGSDIPFKDFGQWYAWMKEKKLLKSFTPAEVDELKIIYRNDYELCRCAVVQKTLMGYINNGLRISDLLKMRAAL